MMSKSCIILFCSCLLNTYDFSWQPDSKFPYSQVRFPPKAEPKAEFLENQEVEVYSRANNQEAHGWWKCKIKVCIIAINVHACF